MTRRDLAATRFALAGLLGATTLTGLVGCSLPGSGPDAHDALARLASRLGHRSLSGVPLTGTDADRRTVTRQVARTLEGLPGTWRPRVEAGSAREDGSTARGTLDWSWTVGSSTWRYRTTVRLARQKDSSGDEVWAVRWSPSVLEPSLRSGDRLVERTVKARRGDVLGAGGAPLVTLRPVLRVGLDRSALRSGATAQARSSAQRLARLVGIDPTAYARSAVAAGPKAFVPAIVYRRAEVPGAVSGGLEAIPGARSIADKLPLAPSKDFAAPLLGTVGPATADVVKQSRGRVRAGDDVGLSGLQRRYDAQLAGTRGELVVARDDRGVDRTLFSTRPVAGKPLRTTLDPGAQRLAQQVLAGVGSASALVALRPSTGEVVAAADGPGSAGYDTADVGRYAPGSTFKIVSSLALLRAGLTPSSPVDCPATATVDGKRFTNYSDYPASGLGRITLADAVANSCNTAFVSQRGRLGAGDLAAAAASLGLGVDRDLGFPVFLGSVSSERAPETTAAANMIGQGTVLASPVAMAGVVASVLHGATVAPRLLAASPSVSGGASASPSASPSASRAPSVEPLTTAEARALRSLMRGVVERGSGRLLAGLGGDVVAKTGTAEFGTQVPLPTHAWMVAGRGDLAVAVFVDRGASGSGTAGPLLLRFLQQVEVS
ncbi:MAG: penicillin-binding protein transpeptidase [Marmoricola sp.]|nr:penicillin-binding protein transpeptidase [Marmoricola sp.]